MQKKFALLQFTATLAEIDAPAIIKKLPQNLWDRYRKNKNPFLYTEDTVYDADGYSIYLPILPEEKDNPIVSDLVTDALDSFDDIAFAWGHDALCPFIPQSYMPMSPYIVKSILIPFMIKKHMKTLNIPLQNAEICIIDSNPLLVEILLYSIYPYINHLSLFTEDKNKYEDIIEDIYYDNGLNVEICQTPSLLQQYHMVIDTGAEECYPYQYKKNAIFFDITSRHRDLDIKREDLWIMDSCTLSDGERTFSLEIFLLYLSIAIAPSALKDLPVLIETVWGIMKDRKINISSCYRMGNVAKPPKILHQ